MFIPSAQGNPALAGRVETMNTKFDNNRNGFNRRIVAEKVGVYAWTIRNMSTGEIVAANKEATLEDARRVVRSTTRYLAR